MVIDVHPPSDWPKTYQEAVAIQESLRHRVELVPLARPVRLVAGVDAICDRGDRRIFGAAALYRYPELDWWRRRARRGSVRFPIARGF